jgi:hypothetical protein
MSIKLWVFGIGAVLCLAFFALVATAAIEDITFPIAELGNCESKEACREYCADEANREACREFAEEHGLTKRARIDAALSENPGPGGCASIAECREYCGQEANREECREFGFRHGLLPEKASDRAHRVQSILIEGGPGGCTTPGECKQFCSLEENREECVSFAEEHNLLTKERIEKFKEHRDEIKEKLQDRTGPGGCTTKEECQLYCEDPAHTEECLEFGRKFQLLGEEKVRAEIERLKAGNFEEYRARFEENRAQFEERMRMLKERFESRQEIRTEDGRFEQRMKMMNGRLEFEERFKRDSSGPGSGGDLRFRMEMRDRIDDDDADSEDEDELGDIDEDDEDEDERDERDEEDDEDFNFSGAIFRILFPGLFGF